MRSRTGWRRHAALVAALFVALALGACGSDSNGGGNSNGGGSSAKPSKPTKTGAAKFTGQHRENYNIAKASCGAFPPAKVARDLGLPASADPVRIAETLAADYRPAFRQAVFEGCLRGLRSP